jgi:hypothetical protein
MLKKQNKSWNPAPSDAYWMTPEGKISEVDQRHITEIILYPDKFGLTRRYIEKIHAKHKEPIGSEGNAREEIMADLIAKGWIRARYVRGNASWTFQVSGRQDFSKVKKLCKHILSAGASDYDQAVVIDLSGFRLDGGEDTISEVVAGALERKKKVSQFAEFLNPAKEFIIWGIPPGKVHEDLLYTKAKSMQEAKQVIKILETKHGCTKCRVHVLDLSAKPDFASSRLFNK